MDLDNLRQNMNTRVLFREPRGLIRIIQWLFAVIAFASVVDFYTTIGIQITCPPASSTTTTTTTTTTTSTTTPPSTNSSVAPVSNTSTPAAVNPVMHHVKLNVGYPFDFTQQKITNDCPGHNATFSLLLALNGSPQFFVTTGVLSLIYASSSMTIYLCFSSAYESIPVWPVADLIATGLLALFWFIASSSFSSNVTLLKSKVNYEEVERVLCQGAFKLAGGLCEPAESPSFKSLNVGLISGFTSFFLWGTGLWFVYKETHFHQKRDNFGPR